jgi:tRNA-dihydrouridine synthase B
VCNVAAGSALLRDEALVARILEAVVAAVPVPVTLKIRTGYARAARNAAAIARIAESAGIAAIAIHGRTREDRFDGKAEHDTAQRIKAEVGIPVIVNGDIATPMQAAEVLARTRADAVMIGRAALGRPWIFREIARFLATGESLAAPSPAAVSEILLEHLDALYAFYGEETGVRVARKHIGWYAKDDPRAADLREAVNRAATATEQVRMVRDHLRSIADAAIAA